ncbi:hypothetical protein BB561_003122 [Smittium simulii]|uniref:SAM domain-containing protein n=1 Tax=Smittium simulii TaxID=133385 RepID=A0A2T9YMV6_9FUNG|nr:hypothetical protein BB561_003122 [Smittium simulii]
MPDKNLDFVHNTIVSWNAKEVCNWFIHNGFSGYSQKIIENDIDGEVLINIANETLIDLGINQLGTRLLILKRIYQLKVQSGIKIDPDTFIPQIKQSNSVSIPATSHNEAFKSFKIAMDHTCHKVLPLALKKYNINDDFKNYRLSIRTITSGKQVEHVLDYNEKPLELFHKLKNKGLSPIFVLKRLRNASVLEKNVNPI